MNAVLIGVLIYVAAQLLIGVLVSRRIASEADYLLAGRSFGYGLATFSIFATWFGAETCIGSAGRMYEKGLSGGSADPFGYTICLFLMGLVFAVPLWRRKLTTLADLFRNRYSPGVERLTVLLMVPTSVLWAAAQIRAFGQVLHVSSAISVPLGTTIGAAVVIIYTVSGGMRADVLTDLIQGIAIIIGLFIIIGALVHNAGDVEAAWVAIDPERLKLFGGAKTSLLEVAEAWAVPICGSVTAQELVSRVIATRSPEVARRSALLGGSLYLSVGLIPAAIGLLGASMFPGLTEAEQILPLFAQKYLSTFFYILFAGALVSAILSTVDSSLLAAGSLVSHNLVVPLKPGLSESAKVRTARAGVFVFGVLAYLLALHGGSIFELVESASSFGSSGIFIVMVFGLFTKFGGARSAFAALTAGLVVWLTGTYVIDFSYAYLASLAAALLAYLTTALTEKKHIVALPESA